MRLETKYNLFDKAVIVNDNIPAICEILKIFISASDEEVEICYNVLIFNKVKNTTSTRAECDIFKNIDECLDELKNKINKK